MTSEFYYNAEIEHRSRELVPGGVLVLAILCINNDQVKQIQQLLYKCAQSIPMTSAELLDFTIPSYLRSYEEYVDEELFAQCSFQLINSNFVSVKSPLFKQWQTGQITSDDMKKKQNNNQIIFLVI